MKTAVDALLSELSARGVTVTAAGDKLHVEAPAGSITADLRAALAEHKQAILGRLADGAEPTTPAPPVILHRIPLTWDFTPSEWLAARGLRIVGGTPFYNGARRPVFFVADIPPVEVAA